jgi:hypothetical protein
MRESATDAPAWFKDEDLGTLRALAEIERGQTDEGDRKAIVGDFCQSLIIRMNLFKDIVLPALRTAG